MYTSILYYILYFKCFYLRRCLYLIAQTLGLAAQQQSNMVLHNLFVGNTNLVGVCTLWWATENLEFGFRHLSKSPEVTVHRQSWPTLIPSRHIQTFCHTSFDHFMGESRVCDPPIHLELRPLGALLLWRVHCATSSLQAVWNWLRGRY